MGYEAIDKNRPNLKGRIIVGINFTNDDNSDKNKSVSKFTNFNKKVDIAAPGLLSDTSMAKPHVVGALALKIQWSRYELKR